MVDNALPFRPFPGTAGRVLVVQERAQGAHGRWQHPRPHVQATGVLPEEGGPLAAEERVDGEAGEKQEKEGPGITAPKPNKASAVFNAVDLRTPSTWPSAAVNTHREMVITKYQKCILTFFFH